ncbi:MAG: DNA recombination protein RmuC [Actinomycetota bacterium]|nr:DNA recombination protein RmuC [Actinomycetota bacterium]
MTELLLAAAVALVAVALFLASRRTSAGIPAEAIEAVIAVANERLGAHTDVSVRELADVRATVDKMQTLVYELERDREAKFGDLTGQLRAAGQQTAALAETTQRLREALAGANSRGQWGERMADDVLRAAGFVEHINYRKQTAVICGGIPDFTFLLPGAQVCHMDVKFPLDNYLRYLDADSKLERQHYLEQFQHDVRQRVKELAERHYDSHDDSIDVVLLFIPNEQVYCFMQEHDSSLLDDALSHKIVLCSPTTLFAVLAVIRQASDSFRLEQRSKEVVALLGGFAKQWDAFTEQMDKVGRRVEGLQKDYETLVGTRRRQLDRQVDRIEDVRRREELPAVEVGAGDRTELGRPFVSGQLPRR